jgi:hypothetical protein
LLNVGFASLAEDLAIKRRGVLPRGNAST